MFGLSPLVSKLVLYGLAALAIVTIIGLAYRHYTGLIDDKVALEKENTRLEGEMLGEKALKEQAVQNSFAWQEAQIKALEALDKSTEVQQAANRHMEKLNEVLAKHDLRRIAQRKPTLLERRLNDGSAAALRMLRAASSPSASATGASPSP